MKGREPVVGDVFRIDVDERSALVQVVGEYEGAAQFLVVFEKLVLREDLAHEVSPILGSPPVLMALSMDAKIHAGDWSYVTTTAIPPSVHLPAYRETWHGAEKMVVDASGRRSRKATDAEYERLPNRSIVAPVRVENALRALRGVGEWKSAYDGLRYGSVIPEEQFFAS